MGNEIKMRNQPTILFLNSIRVFVSLFIFILVVQPAHALVKIDLTDANSDPMPVAITDFAGNTPEENALGEDMTGLINTNLKNTGLFNVISQRAFLQTDASLRVNGPIFPEWRMINTDVLFVGNIEILGADTNTPKMRVVYRLYDVHDEKQLAAKAYTASISFWRHIGHRISDDIYTVLTGEKGYFASRIVYIAEDKPRRSRIIRKRLCVMDQDGGSQQCLTDGRHLVLTPRFSPTSQTIIYMSYANGKPRLYLLDLPTGEQTIVGDFEGLNSSPQFSPNGKKVAMTLTMGHEGNPEIYSMDLKKRKLKRLTTYRGIDTSPSYSPNGKRIVFNSDRAGKPALYNMNSDGNRVQRLTYGEGRYYAPVWSPRGDLIAFVKQLKGKFHIGVIDPDGTEERLLTEGFMDESPTWSPNGRIIVFTRQTRKGDTHVYSIDLTGYNLRRLPTPTQASDPAWSPLIK